MSYQKDGNEIVEYVGRVKVETEKAVLFIFEPPLCDSVEAWIPYSQISSLSIHKGHGKDRIKIPKWIARAKKIPVDGDEEIDDDSQ
jgi:hypothetical protein